MQEKKEEDLQQALNKVFEVGIDEVGTGAIFGPVFAGAVVLTEKNKIESNANSQEQSTNKTNNNNEVVFTDKKDDIELTDELNNARKTRRRSSASIE